MARETGSASGASALGAGRRRRPQRRTFLAAGSVATLAALAGLPSLPASASASGSGPVRAPVGTAGRGSAVPEMVSVGRVAAIPAGARRLGALAAGTSLQVGLALQPRDPAGLAAYAASVTDPASPSYRHYLTPAQLTAAFGPSEASVRAAVGVLKADGLRIGAIPSNRLVVPATGSAGRVEHAFRVGLEQYRLPSGSLGWASDGLPMVPRSLGRAVAAVVGLDQLATAQALGVPELPAVARGSAVHASAAAGSALAAAARSLIVRPARGTSTGSPAAGITPASPGTSAREAALVGRPSASVAKELPKACAAALDTALGTNGWTDDALANAYGLSSLLTKGDLGAGQTIGLYELEPYAQSDVTAFQRCYYGHATPGQVKAVHVAGFGFTGHGVSEAILDIDDLLGLLPKAKILVYEAPNTSFGQLDEFDTIVSEDRVNLISSSWGECESQAEISSPGILQLENQIFEEAAAEGQTFLAAAGDDGSDDCASTQFGSTTPAAPYLSVGDPASQPYVLGVGGVSLESPTNPPQVTAWNDGASGGGGGGGRSNTWSSPPWQAGSGVPGTGPGMRQVPDVSASADEYRAVTVFYGPSKLNGQPRNQYGWTTIGGTSSATPQWAATLALIAGSKSCRFLPKTAGGPDLGFVPPELYAVAGDPSAYAASFTQVLKGNNDVFGLGRGYHAGPGYNMATGLGVPRAAGPAGQPGLAADLCAVATGHRTVGPAVPSVSAVSPASGPVGGGNTVTITGTGFPAGNSSAVRVQFGDAAATVQSVTASAIVATVPASTVPASSAPFATAQTVDVTVTVAGSATGAGEPVTSPPSGTARYAYLDTTASGGALPVVTGIAPSAAVPAGGGAVKVYGSGFQQDGGVSSVTVGGEAAQFSIVSDRELVVTVPPRTASTSCSTGNGFVPDTICQVEVVVSNAAGSSPTAPIKPGLSGPITFTASGIYKSTPETEIAPAPTEFDYAPKPVVTSVTPDPADPSSTAPVVLHGHGFSLLTLEWVDFGPWTDTSSQQFRFAEVTPDEVSVYPPAGAASPGPRPTPLKGGITVQTVQGQSNTVRFSYAGVPAVASLSALGGPQTGGTVVTVRGAGLSDATVVDVQSEISPLYGTSTARVLAHHGDRSLTVRLPAYLPGPASVLPCSAAGCAKADPTRDTFVYFDAGHPAILGETAKKGPASGGTNVVLVGENIDSATAVRFGPNAATIVHHNYLYPDGDPFVLFVRSAPGAAGTSVPVTVVTPTGSTRTPAPVFSYTASAPSPPQSPNVAKDPAGVTLRWSGPVSDGGSAVTGYTAIALPASGAPVGGSVASGVDHFHFGSLQAGVAYTFEVAASNTAHGRGPWAAVGPLTVGYADNGYRVATAGGTVLGFGSLRSLGGVGGDAPSPVVAMATTHDAKGYWLVQADGTVTAFGDAPALRYAHPVSRIVAMASTPTGAGYWLLTSSGTVLGFGDAKVFGKPRREAPGDRAVAIVASPTGRGYAVVFAGGQVVGYGDASGLHLAVPLRQGSTLVSATLGSSGLLLLGSDGRVYRSRLAPGALPPPVVPPADGTPTSITAAVSGPGYWVLTSKGSVVPVGVPALGGGIGSATGSAVAITTS